MPLYVADYLADTGHLSTRQHGAYLLLIMHYWRTGKPLPTRVEHLFRICRLTATEWEEDGDAVIAFFTLTPGGYVHGRIERELQSAQEFIEKRAAAGRASAEAKRQRTGNTTPTRVETHVQTSEQHRTQQEAKTTPSPSPVTELSIARDVSRETTELEKREVRLICEAFNAEMETCFAEKAPLPHATNFATALQMVRGGATADMVRPIIAATLAKMAFNRKPPPRSLSYFTDAVADALRVSAEPMPKGNPDAELVNIPAHLDARKGKRRGADSFDAAVAASRSLVVGE
jgi:uncharacterized protein YdaU (DUF1376 family)